MIDNTIKKDSEKAATAVNTKEKELRAERLRLIKLKIKTQQGDDADVNIENG